MRATRLALGWGLGFGIACSAVFLVGGTVLIDLMTTSPDVRRVARDFMPFAAFAPVLGALAYTLDGAYIGATWARDMRNLMLIALALYLATWWALTRLRQCRAVGVDPGVPRRARAAAGGALSGAAAADVLAPSRRKFGQSAVDLTTPKIKPMTVRNSGTVRKLL